MSDERDGESDRPMSDWTRALPDWLEEAWMTRYLDRELSPDETAWFEAYCLDRPQLLARIEADTSLRNSLAAQRAAFESVRDPGNVASLWRPALALAATLVVGVLVGSVMQGPDDGNAMDGNVTRVVFDTFRGAELEASVDHVTGNSQHVLIEIAVPADATGVAVQIGERVVDQLAMSNDGFVSVLIRRDALQSQRTLRLSYRVADRAVTRELDLSTLQEKQP